MKKLNKEILNNLHIIYFSMIFIGNILVISSGKLFWIFLYIVDKKLLSGNYFRYIKSGLNQQNPILALPVYLLADILF